MKLLKKTSLVFLLILFISISTNCQTGVKKRSIEDMFGKWEYVSHERIGRYGRYDNEEFDIMNSTYLVIDKHNIYYEGLTKYKSDTTLYKPPCSFNNITLEKFVPPKTSDNFFDENGDLYIIKYDKLCNDDYSFILENDTLITLFLDVAVRRVKVE